jgi:hypothetical protein
MKRRWRRRRRRWRRRRVSRWLGSVVMGEVARRRGVRFPRQFYGASTSPWMSFRSPLPSSPHPKLSSPRSPPSPRAFSPLLLPLPALPSLYRTPPHYPPASLPPPRSSAHLNSARSSGSLGSPSFSSAVSTRRWNTGTTSKMTVEKYDRPERISSCSRWGVHALCVKKRRRRGGDIVGLHALCVKKRRRSQVHRYSGHAVVHCGVGVRTPVFI